MEVLRCCCLPCWVLRITELLFCIVPLLNMPGVYAIVIVQNDYAGIVMLVCVVLEVCDLMNYAIVWVLVYWRTLRYHAIL